MKKILSVLLLLLLVGENIIGCKDQTTDKTTSVLRIAAQPYPLLEDVNSVNLSAGDQIAALTNGEIDAIKLIYFNPLLLCYNVNNV